MSTSTWTPDFIKTLAYDIVLTQHFFLVALTFTVYDSLLTLRAEIELVWKRKFTWTSGIYLLNRYLGLAVVAVNAYVVLSFNHSNPFCSRWFEFLGWVGTVLHFSGGCVLVARLVAMYNRSTPVLYSLLVIFFLQLIAEGVLFGTQVIKYTPVPPNPMMPGCLPTWRPSWDWAYWLPCLCFDTFCFALALNKFFKTSDTDQKRASLLTILIDDSLMYFFFIDAVILVNFLLWALARQTLSGVAVNIAFGGHCIMPCRLILNIRKALIERKETALLNTTEMRSLHFAHSGDSSLLRAEVQYINVAPHFRS